jgi:small subunit ribosomal protein S6
MFDDAKVESITMKYTNFLTKNGSTIIKSDNWGRKKFCYPIKKKSSGIYISIEFSAPSGVVSKLEKAYHLDENILRFLTVHFDSKTYKERKAHFERKAEELAKFEQVIETASPNKTGTAVPEVLETEAKSE